MKAVSWLLYTTRHHY